MDETNEVPKFLKLWMIGKASSEVEEWKVQHEREIKEIVEKLRGYKITSGLDENGRPKGRDERIGIDYQFGTAAEGEWRILIEKNLNYSPPSDLEDWQRVRIEKNLTVNQRLKEQAHSQQEKPYQKVIKFLVANWEVLRGIFYPLEVENTQPKPAVFFEVSLSNNDILDVVGIGPDGRYLILEIGKGRKESQIEKYKADLLNMGIPEQMLTGFMVMPSFSAEKNTLVISKIF